MSRILKYELSMATTKIEVGCGSFPLCVKEQNNKPFVWIAVNEQLGVGKENHHFSVVMTGEVVDPIFFQESTYLGTIHDFHGWGVLHVYWTREV